MKKINSTPLNIGGVKLTGRHVMQGTLQKMIGELGQAGEPVSYQLPIGEHRLALNPLLGKRLKLIYSGQIFCDACGRKTKKSFAQGHCFPCMQTLARCDMCVLKPETCHYAQGTCREPEWGDSHCMIPHYVYLANTSGIKVGITRHNQIPGRWIDQGATQALPIFVTSTRHVAGLIEVELAKHFADKTNWRAMLKGDAEAIDLLAKADSVMALIESRLTEISEQFGSDAWQIQSTPGEPVEISYPVKEYPDKIRSHNFDKTAAVEGYLQGIKGQYLLFDTGVINIRKFTSYEVSAEIDG